MVYREWIRRCFSEPRICVGWPSSHCHHVRRCFCSRHAASAFSVARGLFEPLFFHTRVALAKHGRQLGWTRLRPARSLLWFVGDVLEFTHLDDEGQDQGNSVGLVQSFTPGAGYVVNLLWIQDMSLKDWLLSDHGHGNPGRYDLARSNSLDLTVTRGEPPVQPIGTWRRLGTYADYSLADVHWARKQKVHAVAAVDKGIDYWRRHLPHDHPAAPLAPASALPTPLQTPTAPSAFPPLPPVDLAQAPNLPVPEICGSLANEIAQLRHEIDERPVLEGGDGLLRRKAPEPAQRSAPGEFDPATATGPGCSGLFLWRRCGGRRPKSPR